MTGPDAPLEGRVLVMAPWGRDAQVISQVLHRNGISVEVCASFDVLLQALNEGAGLTFLTEEVLQGSDHEKVLEWIDAQPAWSDFPLVVLATKRGGRRPAQSVDTLARLGNVMLLERPLHAETLLSAARSALRARRRQYEIRRHLLEKERTAVETSRLYAAERKAREETFSANEKLAFALESAELGAFHCPLPLQDVVWNATCRAHFWQPQEGAADTVSLETFHAAIHPEDRERVRGSMARAIMEGAPLDIEYRTVSPQGESRWIRARGVAYGHPGREPTRFDGITADIGAQKALETQRETLLEIERNARLEAEHASRMKDEFLATLSHELRTPLTAVIGWIHVLRRQPMHTPEAVRAVDTIDRNARVQAKLIEDLLDMSRIISGHVRLDMEVLDLSSVVDAVRASLEPAAGVKGLRVHVERGAKACAVLGDPARLQQVVWNLLSNAIKFTPPHGEVALRLSSDAEAAVLTVEDDGLGIPTDFLPFVFDRFRQNDASATRAHGGLGLGLAIVKNLVELHGGTVRADSDGAGHGARFSIRLPLAMPVPADADRVAHPSWQRGALEGMAPPMAEAEWERPDLSNFRILVVDDEPDLRELVQQVLQDCGAAVVAVDCAGDALRCVESEHPPDLMVSDIGMPDLDGYQLMRRIRQLGIGLPAIALTAFAGPDDRARALDAGYGVHVVKPVNLHELVETVAEELHSTVRG